MSTIGYFTYDDNKLVYTLEDAHRDVKIAGETRIKAGRYKLEFRRVLSDKTRSYRERFSWFTWHIWLRNVVDFTFVYMHIGNTIKDTDACILTGKYPNNNSVNSGMINESASTFEKFYKWISPKLEANEDIYLEVRDEIK